MNPYDLNIRDLVRTKEYRHFKQFTPFPSCTTMRQLVILIPLLLVLSSEAQSLLEVRKNFHDAVMEPKRTKEFHRYLKESELTSATINAYRAASEAMMARVVWNPISKLAQVIKYAEMMENAVMSDKDNIEIRFLRLSIEYNIPKFLGMSKNLEQDTDMIVKNLSDVQNMDLDPSYGRYILSFLETTKLCTDQEMLTMKQGLNPGTSITQRSSP